MASQKQIDTQRKAWFLLQLSGSIASLNSVKYSRALVSSPAQAEIIRSLSDIQRTLEGIETAMRSEWKFKPAFRDMTIEQQHESFKPRNGLE